MWLPFFRRLAATQTSHGLQTALRPQPCRRIACTAIFRDTWMSQTGSRRVPLGTQECAVTRLGKLPNVSNSSRHAEVPTPGLQVSMDLGRGPARIKRLPKLRKVAGDPSFVERGDGRRLDGELIERDRLVGLAKQLAKPAIAMVAKRRIGRLTDQDRLGITVFAGRRVTRGAAAMVMTCRSIHLGDGSPRMAMRQMQRYTDRCLACINRQQGGSQEKTGERHCGGRLHGSYGCSSMNNAL